MMNTRVELNEEMMEQVAGGKDFTDVVIDKVVDGAKAAKDGVVDGAVWVGENACWVGGKVCDGVSWMGRKIWSFFH